MQTFYKYNKNKTINLDRKCIKRQQFYFDDSKGEPIDAIIVNDAIDRLRILGYNEPMALQPALFERYVAMVSFPH